MCASVKVYAEIHKPQLYTSPVCSSASLLADARVVPSDVPSPATIRAAQRVSGLYALDLLEAHLTASFPDLAVVAEDHQPPEVNQIGMELSTSPPRTKPGGLNLGEIYCR